MWFIGENRLVSWQFNMAILFNYKTGAKAKIILSSPRFG